MSYLLVCLVALIASGLTLVSGFGLGTLLLPAFALFFPIEIAISATAVRLPGKAGVVRLVSEPGPGVPGRAEELRSVDQQPSSAVEGPTQP